MVYSVDGWSRRNACIGLARPTQRSNCCLLAWLLSADTSSSSAQCSQPQRRHHSAHGTRDVPRCSA